jgi:glutamate carboxypeptidase
MAEPSELVADITTLVNCESPSADLAAIARCADLVDALAVRRIGNPAERISTDGRLHLRWTFGTPRVVLLGHLDTVWPIGTLQRWPVTVDGDRISGPGVFDMKAGIVELFAALATLGDLDGVAILITSDEEVGSGTSRQLIESTCRGARAALVLEPSADGALKVARKGVGQFRVDLTGRAAHAGLDPHNGINATVEAAHQILAVTALGDPDAGTTVTPTLMKSGTTANTVPAAASLMVDVRAESVAEMQRVESALQSLSAQLPGAAVKTVAESVRPPLERHMSTDLFATACRLARDLELAELTGVAVGGGSDGNLTAAMGVPTLDGLGAVGGNAHAEGEWASVDALWERTTLLAALVSELSQKGED